MEVTILAMMELFQFKGIYLNYCNWDKLDYEYEMPWKESLDTFEWYANEIGLSVTILCNAV